MFQLENEIGQSLETVLENMSDGYAVFDDEGCFLFANKRLEEITGQKKNQLYGKTLQQAFPQYAAAPGFLSFSALLEAKEAGQIEFYFRVIGKWLQARFIPIREGMVAYVTDITERKKHEESAGYLATLTNSIKDALIGTDTDHIIVSWNAGAEKLYGWSAEEAIGRYAGDLIPTRSVIPGQLAEWQTMLLKKGWWEGEVIQKTKDGREIQTLAYISALKNSEGKMIGAVAFNHDVTEKRKAQNALRESEERLRAMFNQAGVGVCLLGLDCTLLEMNPKFCEILGYPEAELAGRSCLDLTHPADRAVNEKTLAELQGTPRETATLEKRYLRKNNSIVWVRVTIAKMYKQNAAHRYVAIVEDISEHKKAEAGLRESESRFRILAENIQTLAWMANPDGWIFWCNQRWYEYLGSSFETIKGWGWEKTLHPDHFDRVHEFLRTAWQNGQPWDLTFPLKGKDGNYRWFLTSAFPVRGNNGEVLRWIGTCTDIDAVKRLGE